MLNTEQIFTKETILTETAPHSFWSEPKLLQPPSTRFFPFSGTMFREDPGDEVGSTFQYYPAEISHTQPTSPSEKELSPFEINLLYIS